MNAEVSRWIALSGASLLIPLPLLDDWCATRCTRRAIRAHASALGLVLDAETLDVLADDPFRLLGCVQVAVVWPLKKLFRTVLYVLTVKDVLDAAARCALRVRMVELAADQLPGRADAVRKAMDDVLHHHHASPVTRTLLAHPRPAHAAATGLYGWLLRHAGAGVILPAFEAQLRSSP